jgi:hypothetical protein
VLIDKSDSQFKASGMYRVSVTPYLNPDDQAAYETNKEDLDFQYSLKFTLTNKHSILVPGITENGFLGSSTDQNDLKNALETTRQCFIIEAPPSHSNIMISKSLASKTSLFVNIDTDNFKPSIDDHFSWARNDEIGVYLDSQTLKNKCKYKNGFCRIYACLYGPSGERYSIKYIHDHTASLAKTGDLIYDPVPLNTN